MTVQRVKVPWYGEGLSEGRVACSVCLKAPDGTVYEVETWWTPSEEWEARGFFYWWTEGNGGCDCNRKLSARPDIYEAEEEAGVSRCGDGWELLWLEYDGERLLGVDYYDYWASTDDLTSTDEQP